MNTVSEREVVAERVASRISWGALLAGAALAVGMWILFHVLGLAAGLTSIEPDNPSSLRAAGIGTGVWSVIASLLALFIGGAAAARIAGPVDRLGGALHGAVLWGLTLVAGMFLIASLTSMAMSGATRVGSAAVSATGGLATLVESADPLRTLGLDAKDLLAPLNQQLQQQGKPAVTPEQLQNSARESLRLALQQGRFDREILIGALARNTALTRADVADLAAQVEQRTGPFGERIERMQTGALQAAETTGKGLWWVFGALLLSLLASIGGALTGEWMVERRVIERVRESGRALPIGQPAHVPT